MLGILVDECVESDAKVHYNLAKSDAIESMK
jgi:hypothetical protein